MTQQRVVLITGAAKRIGAAIARKLAQEGYSVALHCHRSHEEAASLTRELMGLGVKCTALSADLADEAQVRELIPAASRALGPVTALVNNASLFEYDEVKSFTYVRAQRHYAINTLAPVTLAQALAAQLPQGAQACVVNLLDQKLSNMNPDYLSYTLSKAALQNATQALAQALAPQVRVCAVAPGTTLPSIDNSLSGAAFAAAQAMNPLRQGTAAEDIAAAVSYLLSAKAVTGTTLYVDSGQHLSGQARDVAFLGKEAVK